MKNSLLPLLFTFTVFTAWSCSVAVKPPPQDTEESLVLLDKLNEYNAGVKTLEGDALIVYRDADSTKSFQASVMVQEDRMNFRLDLADFVFKKPLLSIIKNGEDILAVLYFKREFLIVQYEDFDLEKLTGFSIPKEILMPSLIGKVYTGEGSRTVTLIDSSILGIKNNTLNERIYFNNEWLPKKTLYILSPDTYELTFSKFDTTQEVTFPRKIVIKNQDRFLDIMYSTAQINHEIEPEHFNIGSVDLEGLKRADL